MSNVDYQIPYTLILLLSSENTKTKTLMSKRRIDVVRFRANIQYLMLLFSLENTKTLPFKRRTDVVWLRANITYLILLFPSENTKTRTLLSKRRTGVLWVRAKTVKCQSVILYRFSP